MSTNTPRQFAWQLILAVTLAPIFIALTILVSGPEATGRSTDPIVGTTTPNPHGAQAANQPYRTGDGMLDQPLAPPTITPVLSLSSPEPCRPTGSAAAVPPQPAPPGGLPDHTRDPRDMKLLVIAADGKESDFSALIASLNRIGVPYEALIATQNTLTADLLWDGESHGCYQGIMLTTGNLTYFDTATQTWKSAFTNDEWGILWRYEAMFGVRQVTSYTYPGWPNYGLSYESYQDTKGSPLQASLTDAGKQLFPYLNPTNPITITHARTYLATVAVSETATVTPLLVAANPSGAPYVVAAVKRYNDGRENLAVTAENNPNLIHTLLLSYGLVNWVTRGVFLGDRHVTMDVQPDDIFIGNTMWDPDALLDTTGRNFRLSPDDLTALIAWQNDIHARFPVAAGLTMEMPFVGAGTNGLYSPDTLTPVLLANQAEFNWINHTYHHTNLDNITAADTQTELQLNDGFARQRGLRSYSKDAMVQPDISGLYNPSFAQAAYNFGIRYLIADTSRTGWDNPAPNTGFESTFQPGLLIIPRHATNLFYNVRTPEEWVSEYNCYYGPQGTCANGKRRYWDHNLSYAEILDRESDRWVQYLLHWDIDPLMFHQPNLGAYDGVHSLLGDLIEATLIKYSALYTLPIQNLTQHDIGVRMADRMSFNTSEAVAVLFPGSHISLETPHQALVIVTGVAYGDNHEIYGGQPISYISMSAHQPLSVPLP